jgi:NADH-quinone oxidoreductase subunit N
MIKMISLNSLISPVLPEVILIIGAMLLLILGAFKSKTNIKLMVNLAISILLGALIINNTYSYDLRLNSLISNYFINNQFIVFAKSLILIISILILTLYNGIVNKHQSLNNFEFPILVIFSSIGMMIMIAANDFIILYLGLELQSLCLYVLAAYDRDNSRSGEAGIKYFVLGALSSGIILYGISLIYGFTSATHFNNLATVLHSSPIIAILIGLIMVIIGFCFKVSAAPFHMWSPDVYEGSPTIVTAFFTTAPKIAAICFLTRFLTTTFGEWVNQWQQVLIIISVISMFIGAFGALKQTNIKRLLAYSSIGHIGYILIGVLVCNATGIKAVLLYIIIYVAMSLGLFACIMKLYKDNKLEENINSFAGLAKDRPYLAFSISILLFSMAGIPPLAGFFGKFYIFMAAIEAKYIALAILGIISSVISAYYYLKIIKIMYFDENKEKLEILCSKELMLVSLFSVTFNVFFIFCSDYFMNVITLAANSLFS